MLHIGSGFTTIIEFKEWRGGYECTESVLTSGRMSRLDGPYPAIWRLDVCGSLFAILRRRNGFESSSGEWCRWSFTHHPSTMNRQSFERTDHQFLRVSMSQVGVPAVLVVMSCVDDRISMLSNDQE